MIAETGTVPAGIDIATRHADAIGDDFIYGLPLGKQFTERRLNRASQLTAHFERPYSRQSNIDLILLADGTTGRLVSLDLCHPTIRMAYPSVFDRLTLNYVPFISGVAARRWFSRGWHGKPGKHKRKRSCVDRFCYRAGHGLVARPRQDIGINKSVALYRFTDLNVDRIAEHWPVINKTVELAILAARVDPYRQLL